MFVRWYLKLSEVEAAAISKLAERDLRQPGEEARVLLRHALAELGLLGHDPEAECPAGQPGGEEVGDAA